MISNDEKKKILHRRWAITAFIAVIFITAMELWSIVFAIFFMFLVIVLIFWFFEWITGADLDSHNVDEMNKKRKEEGLPPAPYQDEEMDDHDDMMMYLIRYGTSILQINYHTIIMTIMMMIIMIDTKN